MTDEYSISDLLSDIERVVDHAWYQDGMQDMNATIPYTACRHCSAFYYHDRPPKPHADDCPIPRLHDFVTQMRIAETVSLARAIFG